MKYFILISTLFYFNTDSLLGAVRDTIPNIEPVGINDSLIFKEFEKEALDAYYSLENFYNIMLSDDVYIDTLDKFYAKNLASKSFITSANIEDIFENGRNTKKSHEYFDYLYKASFEKVVFDKERKLLTEDVNFKRSPSIKIRCVDLPEGAGGEYGRQYKADIVYKEKHNSSYNIKNYIIHKRNMNIDEFNIFKKINVLLSPLNCTHESYQMTFIALEMIDKSNKSEYKELKEIDNSSATQSSSEAVIKNLKKEVTKLSDEEKNKIIEAQKNADEIDLDSISYSPPGFVDYAIPGIGQLKFGNKNTWRYVRFGVFFSVFISSTTYAVCSKVQAYKYHDMHKSAITFRASDKHYREARDWQNHFLVSAGISLITLITNAVVLIFQDANQSSRLDKKKSQLLEMLNGSENSSIGLNFMSIPNNGIGVSLTINF